MNKKGGPLPSIVPAKGSLLAVGNENPNIERRNIALENEFVLVLT